MDNYNEVKQSLLHTINLCAPNGNVQKAFVDYLHDMEKRNWDKKAIIKTLVRCLHIGLAYNSWPKKINL